MSIVQSSYPPEFLNRIDEFIIFKRLSKPALRDIVDIRLQELQQRLDDRRITLTVEDGVKDWLCDKGYDPRYGARPLNRLISKEIGNRLADKIIRGEVVTSQGVSVMFNADKSGLDIVSTKATFLVRGTTLSFVSSTQIMAPTSSTRKRGGLHSFRSNRQHGQRRRNQRPFNSNSSSRRDGIASSARECSVVAYTENSNSGILDRLSQIQGNRGQQDQDDENEELCHVVMAIDMKEAATVGCCYYIADEQKLYLLEDITSGGLEAIEAYDQFKLPYHLDVRPVQEFNFEGAKLKLANLRPDTSRDDTRFLVPGDTFSPSRNGDENDLGFTDHQGKLLHLSGSIDMDNHISIGCAGALITHLQRKLAAECLAREGAGDKLLNIKSVEMRTLKDTMFVNTDTLTSLQIIQSESHPNVFNQGPGKNSPGAKESLSIYGLFHHFARTPQGRARLRQRFLRPSTDEAHIKEGHDFISTYLRPDNSEAIEKLTKSLKGIKNLRPVMVHVQKGISSGNAKFKAFKSGVWATLLEVCTWNRGMWALEKLDVTVLHQVGRIIHETVRRTSSIHRTRLKSTGLWLSREWTPSWTI
ncbi:mismatch repair protein [Histoplasma capsulatum]|uniref:Mismatch repair protein n=1 Tax=Ajellomyces capsulatus TaxID=5037 RepID=A0A8A1M891_AJECA|nr:mismatch repair protein [Histoplasma capsulatum]